jgi:succinate dehydrogenase / fumarate reductase cytochrome b subunit
MLIFGFVILHLFHFTWTFGGEAATVKDGSLYQLVTHKDHGFGNMGFSALYILLMINLGAHLFHGVSSVFQTFGITHTKLTVVIEILCKVFAIAISAGFITIPVWFLITKGGA